MYILKANFQLKFTKIAKFIGMPLILLFLESISDLNIEFWVFNKILLFKIYLINFTGKVLGVHHGKNKFLCSYNSFNDLLKEGISKSLKPPPWVHYNTFRV